jgi:hypothetical protein
VRTCDECRGAADTLRAARGEIGVHGAALFSAHPAADDLARFVLEPEGLALPALASIGAHVRACPACTSDGALVLRAAAPSLARRLAAWLGGRGAPVAALQPALVVVALALLYPAYLGLVAYPRERGRAAALEARALDLTRGAPALPHGEPTAWSGGGVDALILAPSVRGAGAEMPAVTLRPGQPAQPILIDHAPPQGATHLLVLLRDHAGAVVWRIDAPVEDLWNPAANVLAVLVPEDRLQSGEHTLELATGEQATPIFRAGFRVLRAAGAGAGGIPSRP